MEIMFKKCFVVLVLLAVVSVGLCQRRQEGNRPRATGRQQGQQKKPHYMSYCKCKAQGECKVSEHQISDYCRVFNREGSVGWGPKKCDARPHYLRAILSTCLHEVTGADNDHDLPEEISPDERKLISQCIIYKVPTLRNAAGGGSGGGEEDDEERRGRGRGGRGRGKRHSIVRRQNGDPTGSSDTTEGHSETTVAPMTTAAPTEAATGSVTSAAPGGAGPESATTAAHITTAPVAATTVESATTTIATTTAGTTAGAATTAATTHRPIENDEETTVAPVATTTKKVQERQEKPYEQIPDGKVLQTMENLVGCVFDAADECTREKPYKWASWIFGPLRVQTNEMCRDLGIAVDSPRI